MDFKTSVQHADASIDLGVLHELQWRTSGLIRHQVAEVISRVVNDVVAKSGAKTLAADPAALTAANILKNEGYVRLGRVLDDAQVRDVVAHLRNCACFNAHVPALSDKVPRRIGGGAEKYHYGSYSTADVMAAPHLVELANHPKILAAAQDYLGCLPTLYSIHAWWSFPGHGKAPVAQEFHRDRDDFKFCTLFAYLTDVGERNSPHVFIRRSHRVDLIDAILARSEMRLRQCGIVTSLADLYRDNEEGYGRDGLYERVFDGLIDTIMGPAGSAFLADTSGLHKGVPAMEGPRLMFWARYGLYRNAIWQSDKIKPVDPLLMAGRLPTDWRTAYINRCLIC